MASIVVCIVAVQRIEVITGAGGRRSYTAAEKIRLGGEARTGRGGMAEVVRRHGLCTSLLYRWGRQMANGDLVSDTPCFLPVDSCPGTSNLRPATDGTVNPFLPQSSKGAYAARQPHM